MIKIKRVYEPPIKSDGLRVLVDRLWPRGLSKEKGRIDVWLQDIAPSDSLRKWFGHKPEKWTEFKKRYHAELSGNRGLLRQFKDWEVEKKTVTLLFAAKDQEHNNAVALLEILG